MKAWHFLATDKRSRHGERTLIEVGKTLSANGNLVLCYNGMHASIRLIDALRYAPGPILCRVELSGEVVKGKDKVCARSRTVIAMVDATKILHEFACWTALEALKAEQARGRQPDPRRFQAVETKRKWLNGETTDGQLDAAAYAAYAAAYAAGDGAADEAAYAAYAAAYAARSAAGYAAYAAAYAAGYGAADAADAAYAAAEYAQNENLEQMAMEILGLVEKAEEGE